MYLQNARVTIQITQSISVMTFLACGKYSLQFQWNEMISKWVKNVKEKPNAALTKSCLFGKETCIKTTGENTRQ